MTDKRPITAHDLYKIAYVEEPRVSPDGKWIAYVLVSVDEMENGYKRHIWLATTDGGSPVQITRGGKDSQPRWSPDGSTLAFVSARNGKPQIYLLPVTAPGGEPRPLTSMENGASGPDWSPDGKQIAFLSRLNADERLSEDEKESSEPPADKLEAKHRQERKERDEEMRWDPRPAVRIPYREGTSFRDDRYAQVYVMPVAEGLQGDDAKPRRLTDIDADHTPPRWMPDGKSIITTRTVDPEADEYWRWLSLYRIDVESGSVEQITDEVHSDSAPHPSPDGRWIVYTRTPVEKMTGTQARLAVIPADGGEPRDLTLEFDRSPGTVDWLPDSSAIVFNAGSWGNNEIYRVSPDGGPVEKIVEGTLETQAFHVGPNGGIAFAASMPLSPPELYWQPAGADVFKQVTEANTDLLGEVIVQETHEMRFTGPDGTEIQGWYILPVGYEEGKTYPLALNIHGGPYVMWSSSARSMWHEWQLHAASGYAVFYCNPRGGDGYGQKFRDPLHKAWGDTAHEDIMAGVDKLLELGFVDEDRMAVTGGSYGGYMTAWVVGHTDRFKCAVSQRGVYNLSSFYGTSDVPMLISNEYDAEPWEDPELLWKHSPLAYAHLVKTPLLLIHSEHDYRVPIEQAEQFFAFVRRATDTPVKLLRYPRDGHELSRSGEPRHRVSRLTEIVNWFDTYCQPEKPEEDA